MDSRDEKKTAAPKPEAPRREDVVLVHSPTDDGRGWRVLRKREDRIEAGAIHPVREGQPIQGELVSLRQRAGTPLFDVETHYAPKSGPAQVASSAYRANWDAIFGSRADDTPQLTN
ncbi:hypothetical protein [Sandaracinus amylolyticus]|uniref:Uncharacterized protein n=1 Tax=Sandaracinus amylolyticus TaxID=927083 RepID=A0A0F6W296_9BACT|nr:hypothetical protein [Sandaracinus amylolyticus]AKF05592.1 hypothetical protein DB32_002741 [Sandaracinus amylolyticus]